MTLTIGILLYPGLTQLDVTGPYEVLHRLPDTNVLFVWKKRGPVVSDSGLVLDATTTFLECPPLDVILVPGGLGQQTIMGDEEVRNFVRRKGAAAKYVTSVCAGSLLLGAAGLLDGYEATTHWAFLELLSLFGARAVRTRVAVSGNRITAGGVTAGIDLALVLAAEVAGERTARFLGLALECDGYLELADADLVAEAGAAFLGSLTRTDGDDHGASTRVPRVRTILPLLLLVACASCRGSGGDDARSDGGATCITDTTAGYHEYECDGIKYDVTIPPQCATSACGLVVDVHGLTMDGKMEDDNTNLRALGTQYGYVVVQPNANPAPPASQWEPPGDDDKIYAFLESAIPTLGIDPQRVHFTGFSDGGEMTFRFLCAHADMFASVAAGAATGCFQPGDMPAREIPLLFMNGTKDALVDFQTNAIPQRDAIVSAWSMGPGTVVAQGTAYLRTRFTSPSGNVFELLQHDYEASSFILGGHCYPGSTDPGTELGQLFPFGCVPPNEFTWGIEVMSFFMAHE